MAERKEKTIPDKKEQKVTSVVIDEEGDRAARNRQVLIISIVIGGMLLLLGMVALAGYIVRHYGSVAKQQPSGIPRINIDHRGAWGYGGYRSIEFTSSTSQSDGLNTTTTTRTYVSTKGVVTAVSDSSITVAGAGKSQKITLNKDTDFIGKKPAVNDTVLVNSSKDGSDLTATSVRVLN